MLRHMPEWHADDSRMAALIDDIVARGIDQPLILDPNNRILDGRHRWRAASRANIPTVPVQIRPESDAAGIILGTILQRRHYGKSALAYMAYPLLEKGLDEARVRSRANLKTGQKPQCFPSTISSSTENSGEGSDPILDRFLPPSLNAITAAQQAAADERLGSLRVRDYAIELGVSHDLVTQAGKVHEIFAEDPDYRALMEPRILEGEVGLGATIAGWGGRRTTVGQPRTPTQHEHLWIRTIRSLAIRTARIDDLTILRPALRDVVDRIDDPAHLIGLESVGKALAADARSRHQALTTTT